MSSAQSLTFGQLLKRHRIAAGLTQEALAERAGLSARGISDMERGIRRAPYQDSVSRLAEALHLSGAECAQFEVAARRRSAPRERRIAGARIDTPTSASGLGLSAEASRGTSSAVSLPLAARPPDTLPSERGLPSFLPPRLLDILSARPVRALLVSILLLGLLFPAGAAGLQPRTGGGTLCLATEFPTTGDYPRGEEIWGQSLEDAVRLAVQQHQALGNGYALVVKPYPEVTPEVAETDPQQAARNVIDMVKQPCIVGMVGPAWSKGAQVEMPITANAGLVMISPANTLPALTVRMYAGDAGVDFDQLHPAGKKINYFRTIATDVFQGQELAIFTSRLPPEGLGARNAFVVDDHSFNEALIRGFTQEFLATGGGIVGTASIPFDGAAHIGGLVPRIMAANPDVVVYGGTTDEGGGLLKTQLVQAGYQGLFVGGDGIANDAMFVEQVNSTAATGIFAIDPVPDPVQLHSSAAASFIRDFHARYPNDVVDGYGANAYDAAVALIAAITRLIQQGQAVTREALLDRVQTIQTEGVTGQIAFDQSGDSAHGAFSVYTVQNGRWVWTKQLKI